MLLKDDVLRRFLTILLLGCGFLAAPGQAHPPYGLVADPAGNVYFSDLKTVWRLSRDGRLSVFRPAVPDTHVHELAMAPDGGIYGDQNHYDPRQERFYTGLWHRTLAGAERAIVPMTDRAPRGAGVWQDKDGNRYVTQWRGRGDRRTVLLRRRPNGQVDVLFDAGRGAPRPESHSVESMGGMAFGPDGSLFFADGGVLRRLAPDGAVTSLYDQPEHSSLRGIAVAPDGRVLAADMSAKLVLAVATDGTTSILYQETEGWLPTAVALDGDRLLVLEANAIHEEPVDRVRVIEVKDGRGQVIASPAHPQAAAPASPATGAEPGQAGNFAFLFLGLAPAAAFLFGVCRFGWLRTRRLIGTSGAQGDTILFRKATYDTSKALGVQRDAKYTYLVDRVVPPPLAGATTRGVSMRKEW